MQAARQAGSTAGTVGGGCHVTPQLDNIIEDSRVCNWSAHILHNLCLTDAAAQPCFAIYRVLPAAVDAAVHHFDLGSSDSFENSKLNPGTMVTPKFSHTLYYPIQGWQIDFVTLQKIPWLCP